MGETLYVVPGTIPAIKNAVNASVVLVTLAMMMSELTLIVMMAIFFIPGHLL